MKRQLHSSSSRLVGCFVVSLFAQAIGCAADTGDRGADDSTRLRAEQDEGDSRFAADVIMVRDDYVALRHTAYRHRVFELLRQLGEADEETAWTRLETLVSLASAGGTDGLQTLIVAHADALAHGERSGDAAELLAEHAENLRTRMPTPPLNVLQPLGRASTRVVLNARGDAAQLMLSSLLAAPSQQDLDDLLSGEGLQDDLCGLPNADEVVGASEALLEADARRQQACEEIAAGGAGGASGMMAGMGVDACVNVDLSGARNTFGDNEDGYGDDDRLADLEECIDSFSPNRAQIAGSNMMLGPGGALIVFEMIDALGGDDGAKSEAKSAVTAAVEKGTEAVGKLAAIALQAYVDHLKDKADYQLALQKASDSLGQQIAGLGAEIQGLSNEIEGLSNDIASLQGKIDEFDENGFITKPDGTITNVNSDGKTKEQLEQEKADKEKEKEAKENEKQEKETEKKKAEEVKKEIDKQKEEDDGLDPAIDPACERAMLGGETFDTLELGDDWLDFEKRLEIYSNPNPEEPVPGDSIDGLGLSSCGPDHPSSSMACSSLTHCIEGQPCGCPDGVGVTPQSSEQAAAMASSLSSACAMTLCEDGMPQVVGGVCMCTPWGGTDDPEELPDPPDPPVASQMVEAFFLESDELGGYGGESALGFVMDEILRP